MDISEITGLAGMVLYLALAGIALWGAFCVVMVWMRVSRQRFRSEKAQEAFLHQIAEPLSQGAYEAAEQLCEPDPRALAQLAYMALHNRQIGYAKVRLLLVDRLQRDVMSEMEQWLTWVNTVIKSAPMLGLLGTVVGMMGAFAKLSAGEKADPVGLANDISLALITTAIGLCVAIPLILCVASINTRIRKMEDLISVGLAQFLEDFRESLGRETKSEERFR